MSEEQKYQGSLYKNKNKKQKLNNNQSASTPLRNEPTTPSNNQTPKDDKMAAVAYSNPHDLGQASQPATGDVWQYFAGMATPSASNLGALQEINTVPAPATDAAPSSNVLVHVPTDQDDYSFPDVTYETPAPVSQTIEVSAKSDKKRKRLHVDTSRERNSNDRPSLHTGLTGNLKSLGMPPSPALSGDSAHFPASPTKKSKRKDSLISPFNLFGSSSKSKKEKEKSKSKSKSKTSSPREKKRSSSHSSHGKTAAKLIEAKKEAEAEVSNQMILFDSSKAETFLDLVTDSEHGYSLNKALKKYRKQENVEKSEDFTKELFKSLRLRRNAQGEIVLFVEKDE